MSQSDRDFICPRVIGGLGNQLFVLMTAYALAKEEKTELVIDPRNYAGCPGRRVNIYWDTFLKNLKPFVQWGKRPKRDNVIKEAQEFVFRKLVRKHRGRTQIKGYFQSYKYFDKYRKDIQSFFELDLTTYNYLSNIYKWLDLSSSKFYVKPVTPQTSLNPLTIAIHVRRGDYILKGHHVLPLSYYQECLNHVKDQILNEMKSGRNIVAAIFSDDHIWCESILLPMIKSYFNRVIPNPETFLTEPMFKAFMVSSEKDHNELYMLQYFDIYFLANSTFSWWGAYLNRKTDVRVFMPYRWINVNQSCPPELVYPSWTVVSYQLSP